MLNPRLLAAKIIICVLDGSSLTDAFEQIVPDKISSLDRGFVQELSYGVIRWYELLKKICFYLLKKPLKIQDQDIYALLLIGFYQFIFLKTASYAAIYETVQAAKKIKKNWAVPLINGVLRSYQRQHVKLLEKIPREIFFSHPHWLLNKLEQSWPKNWLAIVEANNHAPPISLRINRLRISRDAYLKKLNSKSIKASLSLMSDVGITLTKTCNVSGLPNFSEGEVSVQDIAAQLAAFLLMLKPKQNVLDACAAPGGKFSHILEMQPDLESVIGIDQNEKRLSKLKKNLSRLRLMYDSVKLICSDAQMFQKKWQGKQFDRILLDAPCSGTGVIRRHPDIKLLRREQDITNLAKQQLKLLSILWKLLKPDGILLYSTCSVLPEENQVVLQKFLSMQLDAREDFINATWGVPCLIGRQLFPEINGTDGFYYARLKKK